MMRHSVRSSVSASPVEHKHQLLRVAIEIRGQIAALEESVQCRERLVNELCDPNTCLRETRPLGARRLYPSMSTGIVTTAFVTESSVRPLDVASSQTCRTTSATMSTGCRRVPSMVMLSRPRYFFGDRTMFPVHPKSGFG